MSQVYLRLIEPESLGCGTQASILFKTPQVILNKPSLRTNAVPWNIREVHLSQDRVFLGPCGKRSNIEDFILLLITVWTLRGSSQARHCPVFSVDYLIKVSEQQAEVGYLFYRSWNWPSKRLKNFPKVMQQKCNSRGPHFRGWAWHWWYLVK